MSHASSEGLLSAGNVQGKDADFEYVAEDGTLTIQGSGWMEVIHDRNIIVVIDDGKPGENKILLLTHIGIDMPKSPGVDYRFEEVHATNLPQAFIDANLVSPRLLPLFYSIPEESTSILYVIVSIGSGTGEAQHYFDDVVKPAFSSCGIQGYQVHITDSNTSILDFTRAVILPHANDGLCQSILLLSGDGGVVDILNILLSSSRGSRYVKPVIGLLAMGTGNALANSTGLNRDLTRGLRHFYRGQVHSLPTFTATFSPGSELLVDEGRKTEPLATSEDGRGTIHGAVVCSWALHASLVADSDTTEYRKFGRDRFQMAANELLAPSDGSAPHIYTGKVTVTRRNNHGQDIQEALGSHRLMYILATLVSNLEEKLTISPDSKPLDGQLRLLHFGPISSADVMNIMGMAFQGGRHVEDQAVNYDSIQRMRIDFDEEDGRWRRVCVDGKIVRVGENGWVEVRKNSSADVLDIIAELR